MAIAGTIARSRSRSAAAGPGSQPAVVGGRTSGPRGAGVRWLAAAALSVAAALMLLAVGNAVAVRSILSDLRSLEQERDAVRTENDALRATLLRMQSLDRIAPVAANHGLGIPVSPPRSLSATLSPAQATLSRDGSPAGSVGDSLRQ